MLIVVPSAQNPISAPSLAIPFAGTTAVVPLPPMYIPDDLRVYQELYNCWHSFDFPTIKRRIHDVQKHVNDFATGDVLVQYVAGWGMWKFIFEKESDAAFFKLTYL